MSVVVNAKGLACPQPVILTKKALDSNDEVTVLVDNMTALENVKRLSSASGCDVEVSEESDGMYRISVKKKHAGMTGFSSQLQQEKQSVKPLSSAGGPTVFVIASNVMGCGNDELGRLLMKSFMHTIIDLEHLPDIMILYNTGVKLATTEYGVTDDLGALEAKGVKILVCGTCVNFFELSGKISAGILSNMYDIAGALSTAGRIVRP